MLCVVIEFQRYHERTNDHSYNEESPHRMISKPMREEFEGGTDSGHAEGPFAFCSHWSRAALREGGISIK